LKKKKNVGKGVGKSVVSLKRNAPGKKNRIEREISRHRPKVFQARRLNSQMGTIAMRSGKERLKERNPLRKPLARKKTYSRLAQGRARKLSPRKGRLTVEENGGRGKRKGAAFFF